MLLGAAACLQLWMKLSGVFGTEPVFGLEEEEETQANTLDVLDVD